MTVPPTAYGRDRASLFRELPDKSLYSDYYKTVQKPISLQCIRAKIDEGLYSWHLDQREPLSDMLLMFANARQYNVEGSEPCADASALQVRHCLSLAFPLLSSHSAFPCDAAGSGRGRCEEGEGSSPPANRKGEPKQGKEGLVERAIGSAVDEDRGKHGRIGTAAETTCGELP